ncbi:MAG: 16S rRNA (cytosine(1402)-N(4))-methyltransferase [Candidatus Omnitrophica bacterium CG1_02_44_16]|nr:MAG: 16S rRNA (cytosine(1402)-N(4))-methyltransferase [Candidatus Omnitrophica bacterium CG1_02_44_16]PIY82323.1 MAG: 16S rRNA (cytosine(1402)-N(4))-methyltransferase [Candidatus Omnitrophica bacterium CG_4_10_14_0_8_um_filter_44_12]PIZ84063.1 MAG: 16S rRNA (cytosine(1402)-N(4))-methyltransferase [Candidatus Omnitrophica bacterium CG_4_10_14_0_2_um_filter_44_9]
MINYDAPSGIDETPKRKRRVRYKGTHPKRFDEKYKELDPEKYANDIEKILKSGKTPAGMHRSICVKEILEILGPKPGQTGLDATLGFGGHAQELLSRVMPGGRLFGIDVDPIELTRTEARLRALGFTDRELILRQINFAGIPKMLADAGGGFDFILADLGVSSMQLDDPARCFTFKWEGPLDLRFNPQRGQPASALIKSLSEKALEEILFVNSDEPYCEAIARAIHKNCQKIFTTKALVDTIKEALAFIAPDDFQEKITKSIRRTFQALRVEVNDEFSALEQFLRNLPICLKPNGRVAILTFHSGEDNRVVKFSQEGLDAGAYSDICREPIRPTPKKCFDNPRSKSAFLRWAIRKKLF